jgi:hypothetical protein
MRETIDVIAECVERESWIWRLIVIREAQWRCVCNCVCHAGTIPVVTYGGPDYVFPIHKHMIVRLASLYKDPATNEVVDEYEACRRIVLRQITNPEVSA